MSRPARWAQPGLRIVGATIAFGLFAFTLRDADLARVGALIAGTPALLLVPLVYPVTLSFDTLGWRRLLGDRGAALRFGRLFGVRLSTEAVGLSLPSGTVLAEGAATWLLGRQCDVPVAPAVASQAARRVYIFLALSFVLAAGALLGHRSLREASEHLLGRPGLEWLCLAVAAGLFLVSLALRSALLGGALGSGLHRLLAALPGEPGERLRRWLAAKSSTFTRVDHHMADSLAVSGPSAAVTVGLYVAVWLCEALETFLILTFLGAGLALREVFALEPPLAFLRSLVFVLPAGLGLQDAGYVGFFRGLGVSQAVTVGAAFVLVKRCKEIFWIGAGYLLLARHSWRPERSTTP